MSPPDVSYQSPAYFAEFRDSPPKVDESGRSPRAWEETAVPSTGKRWVEEGIRWLREKQSKGRYLGRNGYDALRFLRLCGTWVSVTPKKVAEPDLWEIVKRIGPAPKTKRTYLAVLASFLVSQGNWIVQESGIRSNFPNRPLNTPVITAEDRERVIDAAQGPERIVTSLLGVGRRRIEIVRAEVGDFHLDREPATYDVRQKGGAGKVTDRDLPVVPSLRAELAWWLPLRSEWSDRAESDSGHLICRWERESLVGVSSAYVDRLLHAAEDRAGTRRWPAHSFRRGAATLLRERGADWEDVSEALTHASPETTRAYISPFVRRRRLAAALELIEPARPARGKP